MPLHTGCDLLSQFFHTLSAHCTDRYRIGIVCFFGIPQIVFIKHDDIGYISALYQCQQLLLRSVHLSVFGHQHGYVTLHKHFFRPADTQHTQPALIIISGGIYYRHRSERQKLHTLLYGISGRPLYIAHNGHLLPCDTIYQTALACIAQSEKTDMYTLCRRCLIKTHFNLPSGSAVTIHSPSCRKKVSICSALHQKRKSLSPSAIFTSLSRTISRTDSFGIFPISRSITSSPILFVSSEA